MKPQARAASPRARVRWPRAAPGSFLRGQLPSPRAAPAAAQRASPPEAGARTASLRGLEQAVKPLARPASTRARVRWLRAARGSLLRWQVPSPRAAPAATPRVSPPEAGARTGSPRGLEQAVKPLARPASTRARVRQRVSSRGLACRFDQGRLGDGGGRRCRRRDGAGRGRSRGGRRVPGRNAQFEDGAGFARDETDNTRRPERGDRRDHGSPGARAPRDRRRSGSARPAARK